MDNLKPQRRRFQFSLRKLMLWMVVCAAYLGILRWADMATSNAIFISVWLGVILLIRLTLTGDRGLLLALGVSVPYLACWIFFREPDSYFLWVCLFGAIGFLLGFIFFVVASFVVGAVNAVDALMQSRTDRNNQR